MTMQADDQYLGQVAYEAYRTNLGGRGIEEREELPLWEELDDASQTGWIAAAREVLANRGSPEDDGDEPS
jgi:hypothetical protein